MSSPLRSFGPRSTVTFGRAVAAYMPIACRLRLHQRLRHFDRDGVDVEAGELIHAAEVAAVVRVFRVGEHRRAPQIDRPVEHRAEIDIERLVALAGEHANVFFELAHALCGETFVVGMVSGPTFDGTAKSGWPSAVRNRLRECDPLEFFVTIVTL